MPTGHSFIDIYSALLRVSFLSIVELRLSTLNKPISDLIWSAKIIMLPNQCSPYGKPSRVCLVSHWINQLLSLYKSTFITSLFRPRARRPIAMQFVCFAEQLDYYNTAQLIYLIYSQSTRRATLLGDAGSHRPALHRFPLLLQWPYWQYWMFERHSMKMITRYWSIEELFGVGHHVLT